MSEEDSLFSFEQLHEQFSLETWETTLRLKQTAKNSKGEPSLHQFKIAKQCHTLSATRTESQSYAGDTISFVSQLEIIKQAQEIIAVATERCHLDGLPFYNPPEYTQDIQLDDFDQTCECLFGFMQSISRKTGKNFLAIRHGLGRKYDNLVELLVEVFKHSRRVQRSIKSLQAGCNELRDLTYKSENAEHHIRKYKNISPVHVSRKAKELEVNTNMLCMWDHKLETLLFEASCAITEAYEEALHEESVPFHRDSTKIQRAVSQMDHTRVPIRRVESHDIIKTNSKGDLPKPRSRASSPILDLRSKSLSISYDGSPFLRSFSKDVDYPPGIDPLIVSWLRRYSMAQYIPMFSNKNLTFFQFCKLQDVDFAEMGISSGEDCISLGILLSNNQGPNDTVVIKEGIMSKRGNIRKSWKKRLFRLVSSYEMFYYKPNGDKPIGSIDLLQVFEVKRLQGNVIGEKSFYFYFQMTTKDRCWLISGDEVTIDQWCSLLHHTTIYCKDNNLTRDTLQGVILGKK